MQKIHALFIAMLLNAHSLIHCAAPNAAAHEIPDSAAIQEQELAAFLGAFQTAWQKKYAITRPISDTKQATKKLLIACKNGDLLAAQKAMRDSANINGKEDDDDVEETPLYYAVESGNIDLVTMLIEAGAEENLLVLIEGACNHNHIPLLKHLIVRIKTKETTDLKLKERRIMYCSEYWLPAAIRKNNTVATELLIEEFNINIDSPIGCHGYGPLATACRDHKVEIATMLLQKKANIDAIEAYQHSSSIGAYKNHTPLSCALISLTNYHNKLYGNDNLTGAGQPSELIRLLIWHGALPQRINLSKSAYKTAVKAHETITHAYGTGKTAWNMLERAYAIQPYLSADIGAIIALYEAQDAPLSADVVPMEDKEIAAV